MVKMLKSIIRPTKPEQLVGGRLMKVEGQLSSEEIRRFDVDGYFVKRSLFNQSEMANMIAAVEGDPLIEKCMFHRTDNQGNKTSAVQWNNPGKSSYGIGARLTRVVETVETLLRGEVYHWQSKLTAKDPNVGGAWEWHQDYGYWYNYGCLYPEMLTVMVALDRATKKNGCLQLLRGSQKIGRIDHIKALGGQVNADRERVDWAIKRHQIVPCELEVGDAVFFHCNLLHSSGPNLSSGRRWALLYCYNRATNDPFQTSHNPNYRKLLKVSDEQLFENGVRYGDGTEEFQTTYVKPLIEKKTKSKIL